MQSLEHSHPRRDIKSRTRLMDRLVYVPGALLLVYGSWLALTA